MTEVKRINFRTEFLTSSPPGMVKSDVLQVGTNSLFALEKLPRGVSWYYINITWISTTTEINDQGIFVSQQLEVQGTFFKKHFSHI